MKNLRYGRLSYAYPAMIIGNKDNKKGGCEQQWTKKELSLGKTGFYKYQSL